MILNCYKNSIARTISYRFFSKAAILASASEVTKSSDQQSNDLVERTGRTGTDIEKLINLDKIRIVTKKQTKKPERLPLAKNFFVNEVDKELLAYPQVIDYKDYDPFLQSLKPITDYFQNKVACIDDISKSVVSDLKRLKLFGSAIGEYYGGIGHYKTESSLASESEAIDVDTFLFLNRHRLVAEAIADHGSAEQRDKYLPDLAKGNLIGTVCFHELNPLDKATGGIVAERIPEGGGWSLNGSRSFVINSANVNLLLVLAKVKPIDSTENPDEEEAVAFLVNTSQRGVMVTEDAETIAGKGTRKTKINFSDVTVINDDVLSNKSGDCDVIQKVIQSSRTQESILAYVQIKRILNYLTEHVIQNRLGDTKLFDLDFIKIKLGQLTSQLYQLESMIYLTTGLIDEYENPKVDYETAMVKAFSQDCLLAVSSFALGFINENLLADHPLHQYIKEVAQLKLIGETNDTLKQYIGTNGALHCKDILGRSMKPRREKKAFPLVPDVGDAFQTPTSNLELFEYLHPSFEEYCFCLESTLARLEMASEMVFTRYGEDAMQQTLHFLRLGEAAILAYSMFASLARASRSYCVGLKFSKHDTVFGTAACQYGMESALQLLQAIRDDEKDQQDSAFGKLAESIMSKGNYYIPSVTSSKKKS